MSERALTVVDSAAMDIVPEDKIELLRHTFGQGLGPAEFDLYVQQARRLRLDPFAGQILAVKRGGRMTIQTTIDGFRSKAEETGEYEGQTAAQWCAEDGEWRDVWLAETKPAAARVGVYRKGFREPMYAVAPFDAYNQGNGWWKSPGGAAHMLAKCAEALALRKAFPRVLGGVYSKDEMGSASEAPIEAQAEPATQDAPEAQGEWQEAVDHPAVKKTTEALGGEVSGARAPRTETPIQIEDWADTAHRMLADLRAQLNESTIEGFVFDGNPPASLDRFFSPAEIQTRGREDGRRLVAVMREALAVQAGGAA